MHLGPDQWEELPPCPVSLSDTADDALDIEVRVWDRKRDGQLRGHPILVGHKHVRAKDLESDRSTPVTIHLTLMEGAASEFD